METHPIAEILPEMSAEDYARLRDDIAQHGLRESIWTYEGKVLDGRHRFRACEETGAKAKFRQYRGNNPKLFVWEMNGARRHLTKSQLAALAAELVEDIEETEGRPRQRSGKSDNGKAGGRGRKKTLSPHGDKVSGRAPLSSAKAAAKTGASARNTQRAKRVKDNAPDLHKAVRDGKQTLAQAERELKRREKQAEMDAKAAAIKEEGQQAPECKVICGDCVAELKKLSGVRCIFADPPYNIGVDYGGGHDDKLDPGDYLDWCRSWIRACCDVLTDDGSLWVMINDEWAADFALEFQDAGLTRRAWIKWYETFGVNCSNNFNRTSRHIFYCVIDPKRFVFNHEPIIIESQRQAVYKDRRADHHGKLWDDVWFISRLTGTSKERIPDFPTQVPEAITDAIVQVASDPGDLVIDPFSGSGTTGVSCRRHGRRFIGIERNQEFADRSSIRIYSTEAQLHV